MATKNSNDKSQNGSEEKSANSKPIQPMRLSASDSGTNKKKAPSVPISNNAVSEKQINKSIIKDKKEKKEKKEKVKEAGNTTDTEVKSFDGDDSKASKKKDSVGSWFTTLCFAKIPIVGLIFLIVVAVLPKSEPSRKAYARAAIIYRVLVLALAAVILYAVYYVGLDFVDNMLSYVEAHSG